ncbi:hypothetical protein BCV70DRAFT_26619 [Testicularia cyperi]|uniref:Uncharacterized protein n=1 Tax=Testicularia cyperi TaxID=1882483 RepID=A0A317XK93_9BASI|nr:hypothetical protein BCV70DRAFT_26619 [Testicularia cyperi]
MKVFAITAASLLAMALVPGSVGRGVWIDDTGDWTVFSLDTGNSGLLYCSFDPLQRLRPDADYPDGRISTHAFADKIYSDSDIIPDRPPHYAYRSKISPKADDAGVRRAESIFKQACGIFQGTPTNMLP